MIKLNTADQLDLIYQQVTLGVRCDSSLVSVECFLEIEGLLESTEGKSEEESKKIVQKNFEEAKIVATQIATLRKSDTMCASALAKHLNIDVAQLTSSPNGKLIWEVLLIHIFEWKRLLWNSVLRSIGLIGDHS